MLSVRLYIICALVCIACSAQAREHNYLQFVKNVGQWDRQVLFEAEVQGGSVFFTGHGFRYSFYDQQQSASYHDRLLHQELSGEEQLSWHAYDVIFKESNEPVVTGADVLPYYHNYFIGNDESRWASHVPVFGAVQYEGLYHNIDARIYSKGPGMKYDLIVKPGGNAKDIQLSFAGVTPRLNDEGELVITTSVNTVRELAPYAYQLINGEQKYVPCNYELNNGELSFAFPDGYDHAYELVIDPALVFATYTGGTADAWGQCVGKDNGNNLILGVEVRTPGWPVTTGAFQTNYVTYDVGINKYSDSGTNLLYSTYYGGNASEYPTAITVNSKNQVVVTGYTSSTNLPMPSNAYHKTHFGGTGDIFVIVFSVEGAALIGGTYMGGANNDGVSDYQFHESDGNKYGLAIDDADNIYVAASTYSDNCPTTPGAYQRARSSSYDGYVFKMSPNCSSLIYGTYIGGNHTDCIYDCLLDKHNNLIITGATFSADFPLSAGAYSADGTAFVTILNANASAVLASTRLGEYTVNGTRLSLDDNDNIYVAGVNYPDLAVSPNVFSQPTGKVFIAKMSPDLEYMLVSTKLVDYDKPAVVAFNTLCGEVMASICIKDSTNLPLTPDAYQTTYSMFYLFYLNKTFDTLLYGSYIGPPNNKDGHIHGVGVIDSNGVLYQYICNNRVASKAMFGTAGSYCPVSKNGAVNDPASFKFDFEPRTLKPVARIIAEDTGCLDMPMLFDCISKNAYGYQWDFGDGQFSFDKTAMHAYAIAGTYTVMLKAFNPYSCLYEAVSYRTVYIDSMILEADMLMPDTICMKYDVNFQNISKNSLEYFWDFGDGTTSTQTTPSHKYAASGLYFVKLVGYNGNMCNNTDTMIKPLFISRPNPEAGIDAPVKTCTGQPVVFNNTTRKGINYSWNMGDGGTSVATDPTYVYSKPGTYTVRLIANNPALCFNEDTTYATIEVIPDLELILKDTFVCHDGKPVTIGVRAQNVFGRMGYQWQNTQGVLSSTDQQYINIDPLIGKQFTVTVTDTIDGLCVHTATATMNVYVLEYPDDIVIRSNSPLCEGDTLEMLATCNIPTATYSWNGPVGFSAAGAVARRPKAIRDHSGAYNITVSNENCAIERSVDILVKPRPFVKAGSNSPVYEGYELRLEASADLVDNFTWKGPNGFSVSGQQVSVNPIKMSGAGTYTAMAEYNGCVGTATIEVKVEIPDSQYVHLYANPNIGRFFIEGKSHVEQQVQMRVINTVGQNFFETTAFTHDKHFKHEIVLPEVADGVYMTVVLMDGKYWYLPFTILKE